MQDEKGRLISRVFWEKNPATLKAYEDIGNGIILR